METEIRINENCICALLSGEIDHHSATEARMLIDSEIEKLLPKTLILDFSGVQFMDSSGIGLILGRQRMMTQLGGSLHIKNTPPLVRKIITLAGLSNLILSGKDDRNEI